MKTTTMHGMSAHPPASSIPTKASQRTAKISDRVCNRARFGTTPGDFPPPPPTPVYLREDALKKKQS